MAEPTIVNWPFGARVPRARRKRRNHRARVQFDCVQTLTRRQCRQRHHTRFATDHRWSWCWDRDQLRPIGFAPVRCRDTLGRCAGPVKPIYARQGWSRDGVGNCANGHWRHCRCWRRWCNDDRRWRDCRHSRVRRGRRIGDEWRGDVSQWHKNRYAGGDTVARQRLGKC